MVNAIGRHAVAIDPYQLVNMEQAGISGLLLFSKGSG
jgi:hypothetical protein